MSFAYDVIGRRTVMTDGQGTTSWAYDGADRPVTITQPYVGSVGYTYDSAGDRLAMKYPDGKVVSYTFDVAARLVQVTDWLTHTTAYAYNAVGQLLTDTLPNGVTTTVGYDPAERLIRLTHQGLTQTLGIYTYTVDAVGNRVSVTETLLVPGTGISTTAITYNYDTLYRLKSANYSTGSVYTYTYDAVGNRLADGAPSGVTTYTYDIANRLGTINGTISYTWDNNGNLVNNGQNVTYTYDSANRLIALNTSVYTFGYNGQGDRMLQLANGTRITYTLDLAAGLTQVLSETKGTGTTIYLFGQNRIAQKTASTTDYFLPDGLGSVRQLADANGSITLQKSYDPFGQTVTSSGSDSSNYDFAGEYKDPSALIYLRARYYTSYLNQFIQPDSIVPDPADPRTTNRYAYVNDNPINYTDPSGHSLWPSENVKALQALKSYIVDSASRHNTSTKTGFTNEAFAALMAAYLNRESRLGARTFRSVVVDPLGDILGNSFGYDASTGIANIRPSVGVEILRGEIQDVLPRGSGYLVCGSGYDQFIQENTYYQDGARVTPGDQDPALRRFVFKELQNPVLSIEYLAANIERGGDKAVSFGVTPSVFNMGNWLWRGVVTRDEYETAWKRGQNWTTYGVEMINDMPMAFQVLGLPASYYNAYNPKESDFVDGTFFNARAGNH